MKGKSLFLSSFFRKKIMVLVVVLSTQVLVNISDRHTDRPTGKQTPANRHKETEIWTDRQTNKQTDP